METENLSLYHIIRESKTKTENAPVIIMLHGYGSNEADLFSFSEELPEEVFIISARAPYPLPPYGNAWYAIHWDGNSDKFSDDEQAVSSREMISAFIDEVIATYPVNPENVSIIGFSQGTILGYSVALSYPEKVKNLIGLSGYINEGILKENYQKNDFSGLSVYQSHGTADQVIPVQWARKSKAIIEPLKIDYQYSEFPVGHGVSPQNLQEVKQWLAGRI